MSACITLEACAIRLKINTKHITTIYSRFYNNCFTKNKYFTGKSYRLQNPANLSSTRDFF